jgi:mannonate dehydratase
MAMKISMPVRDLAEETLRFCRQIGVEGVSIPGRYVGERVGGPARPLVPRAQESCRGFQARPWDEEELKRICGRVEEFGLVPLSLSLGFSRRILLGEVGREADAALARQAIGAAGRAGIGVLHCNFTALRASAGYQLQRGAGRGGADLRRFDYEEIRRLPPIDEVGSHSAEEMWERLEWVLRQVVPAAEEAGVRLAMHPNDPPVPVFRGVAQPLTDLASMKRLIDVVDSPANSVFFDTGVTTEWGEDAVEVIGYFGGRDRIAAVHFRNVRVQQLRYRYLETFIDEGDCDMAASMAALKEVGYDGGVDPDHTPGISGDSEDMKAGWTYAVAYMRALRKAC